MTAQIIATLLPVFLIAGCGTSTAAFARRTSAG